MGIISQLHDSVLDEENNYAADIIENVIVNDDILEDVLEVDQDEVLLKRRSKKVRQVQAGSVLPEKRPKGAKKRRRYEQMISLLEMADPDDLDEVTIHDFYTPRLSPFAQLLLEKHYMMAWNKFICSSEVEQGEFLRSSHFAGGDKMMCDDATNSRGGRRSMKGKRLDSTGGVEDLSSDSSWEDIGLSPAQRAKHPAFTPEDCYQKIDGKLRQMLRKRNLPMGLLSHLEDEVVNFFTNYPDDVCMYQLESSFHRVLLHAVSQYLSLLSYSFEDEGSNERKCTYIEKRDSELDFQAPRVLLSKYLESIKTRCS